jgi:P27 family predicted phage terminase small subunit
MGKRGPLQQSEHLRLLKGNPGKRSTPPPIAGSVGLPRPPSWLRGEGLREWRRITPELDKMGLINHLDRGILASYCTLWETFCELRKIIAEEGSIIEGKRNKEPVKSPAWTQLRETTTLLITIAKEIGLTPSSRLRMPNPLFDPDPDMDELEAILSQPTR